MTNLAILQAARARQSVAKRGDKPAKGGKRGKAAGAPTVFLRQWMAAEPLRLLPPTVRGADAELARAATAAAVAKGIHWPLREATDKRQSLPSRPLSAEPYTGADIASARLYIGRERGTVTTGTPAEMLLATAARLQLAVAALADAAAAVRNPALSETEKAVADFRARMKLADTVADTDALAQLNTWREMGGLPPLTYGPPADETIGEAVYAMADAHKALATIHNSFVPAGAADDDETTAEELLATAERVYAS